MEDLKRSKAGGNEEKSEAEVGAPEENPSSSERGENINMEELHSTLTARIIPGDPRNLANLSFLDWSIIILSDINLFELNLH